MRSILSILCSSLLMGAMAFASSGAELSASPAPLPQPASYVDQDPSAKNAETKSIEVYVQRAKSFSFPGITGALTMDPNACQETVEIGRLEVLGLTRGDCVIIYWTKAGQTNLLIHVVDAPIVAPPPSLARAAQFGTTGFMRTFVTGNLGENGKSMLLQNELAWNSSFGPGSNLSVQATTEDALQRFGRGFNFTSFSATLRLPNAEATVGDFSVLVRPSAIGVGSLQFASPVLTLRGAEFRLTRGDTSYDIFAGTGIPSFFLNYGGAARAAGMDYRRQMGEKISLLIHGLYSSVQNDVHVRQNDITLLPVVILRPNNRLNLEAGAGFSNHGLRLSLDGSYRGERFDVFTAFSRMNASFPFQLLHAGAAAGENLAMGGSFRVSRKLSLTGTYQRSFADFDSSNATHIRAGNSVSISSQYMVSSKHVLNADYSLSASPSTIAAFSVRHFDAGMTSQLGSASNTVQFSMAQTRTSGKDVTSDNEISFMDGVRYSLRRGIQVSGGVSYARTNFPLLARIQQELALLSPQLQDLFAKDPAAFLNSNLLPSDIRAAIDNVQPSSFQFNAGAEFSHGRWSLAPHVTFGLQNLSVSGSHNLQFGYQASYAINKSLWLTSSLSSQYFVSGARLQRSSIITFGLQRTLSANPFQWLTARLARRSIHGRVFIDRTGDGMFHAGDHALAGIVVRLSNGSTATTGANGEFEFHGLSPRTYRVSLDVGQFRTDVRLTGASELITDLSSMVSSELDFGVVDFARITGVVYNDYLISGERQPDAPRLAGIRLQLARVGAAPQITKSDDGGEFDVVGLEPGHYKVNVEPDSLPPGYFIGGEVPAIDLLPTSAARVELPVRAMHSISGKVLYRETETSVPRPVAGVTVTADHAVVQTNKDGTFLLRNLPAGEINVRVLPASGSDALSMELPKGKINMPREPKQIENATILITSPELLKCVSPHFGTTSQTSNGGK